MVPRLKDRLKMARRRQFVGRSEERRLFEDVLRSEASPLCLFHIHGPGGIGKTTLLSTFAGACAHAQTRALLLDGRDAGPDPAAFVAALRTALDLDETADPLDALAADTERHVLLIDTYELLTPLDTWLREVFLPELPAQALVVTAGRHPLSAPWHTDPGWQSLLRELPLHPFSHEESRTYLTRRDVDPEQHAAILDFTHGHPLALSLVADLFEQEPDVAFEPEAAPDVIKALVDQFVLYAPGPSHRAALEACALVRVVNEALLSEMLAVPDAGSLFGWLRGVSFIESGPYGLAPHDLAREALSADLRWRNPDWFAELHDRARTYYARRLAHTRGREQQRVLSDYMYLHRDNPVIKPFLDWQETGGAVPEPPTEADFPLLQRMVARHEGEASAEIAAHWFARQPEGVLVFRGADHEPTGFLASVALHKIDDEDRATDPAVEAACQCLAEHAPLRPGERATHFRFWMAADTYQDVSPLQSLLFLKIAQHYLTTPDLAFTFFPCADAEFWAPFCEYAELALLSEASYEIGDRRYGVFGHDWRLVPPMQWLDHLAARELATSPEPIVPDETETPLLILDEAAFADAVRAALRAYVRPHTLSETPLLRTRLVARAAGEEADEADRIEALRHLVKEAADTLLDSPREAGFWRVLDRTYFRPARSQEQAAELLDLPFSTYRRHLKRGIGHVAERLWQQELGTR